MRIAWAMDVFSEERSLSRKMVTALAALTKELVSQIEPVYVLSPGTVGMVPEFFHVQTQSLQKMTEKKLRLLEAEFSSKVNLVSGTILLSPDDSLRMAVSAFVSYAKQTKVDLIAVSSSGKKSVSRFLLGSFAETMVMHSDVPVFLVNPPSHIPKQFSAILFPTDLSERSKHALSKVIPLARERDLRVVLFHNLIHLNPTPLEVFPLSQEYSSFVEDNKKKRRDEGEKLRQWSQSQGVKTDFKMVENSKSTADNLLSLVKSTPRCFVAMPGQTGPYMQSLLGNVTREIIRKASCPLWIVHT